jgi:hypothetical protein
MNHEEIQKELKVAKANLNLRNDFVIFWTNNPDLLPLYCQTQSDAVTVCIEDFPEEEFRITGTYQYIQELEAQLKPEAPKEKVVVLDGDFNGNTWMGLED